MGRELPILFNVDMVRAILEGRKTATRRAIRPRYQKNESGFGIAWNKGTGQCWIYAVDDEGFMRREIVPPCLPDDILYVRETWAFIPCVDCMGCGCHEKIPVTHEDRDSVSEGCYIYRAGHENPERITWRPSIHMPKEAARIWLKVMDVRVERLQDITNDQILKEGISKEIVNHYMAQFPEATEEWVRAAHFLPFSHLWNTTIKKSDIPHYGWNANPWVWAIGFERCGKPEETL